MNKREIKFRLWDKENKSWHSPNILEVWDESGEMTPYEYVKSGKLNPIYVPLDNWIINQYTGLKDKNGKEIYEGDIVKYQYAAYEHDIRDASGEVFFKDGMFLFDRQMEFAMNDSNFIKSSLEVVGNIFENPQFLNQN